MANKDSNASKTKAKPDIISNMRDSKSCDIVLDNKTIEETANKLIDENIESLVELAK